LMLASMWFRKPALMNGFTSNYLLNNKSRLGFDRLNQRRDLSNSKG
jgi:hypothetical protein